MTVPTKLRRELSSSPSTVNLPDFLEVMEVEGYDDTEIQGKVSALETTVGDSETADTLVYDVADIKAYIAQILTANNLTDPRANAGTETEANP